MHRLFNSLILFSLITLVISCKTATQNEDTNIKPLPNHAITSKVLLKYLDIKDALVAGDTGICKTATINFLDAMEQLKERFPKNNSTYTYLDSMQTFAKKIDKSALIDHKRSMFSLLSNSMNQFLKSIEIKNAHIYHQFCPMALHDTGAFWLSQEADIKNPYFGKEMLECGETVDSLN